MSINSNNKYNLKTEFMKYLENRKRQKINKTAIEKEAKLRETFFPFISPKRSRWMDDRKESRNQSYLKQYMSCKTEKKSSQTKELLSKCMSRTSERNKVLDLLYSCKKRPIEQKAPIISTTEWLIALKMKRASRIMKNVAVLLEGDSQTTKRLYIPCAEQMRKEKVSKSLNKMRGTSTKEKLKWENTPSSIFSMSLKQRDKRIVEKPHIQKEIWLPSPKEDLEIISNDSND